MSEEVRAIKRRSRALPVAESRALPVERFPDTAAPTDTEATTGGSLWVDLRHGRRIDVGRGWLFSALCRICSWSELGHALDRAVEQTGQHLEQVLSDGDAESTAALDNREDGGDLWASLLAADMDPIAAFIEIF
jgi:hypothetical protein